MTSSEYDHVWRWRTCKDPWRPWLRVPHPYADRVGTFCRVLARGTKNSVLIEFEDGLRSCCSRYAVQRRFPQRIRTDSAAVTRL